MSIEGEIEWKKDGQEEVGVRKRKKRKRVFWGIILIAGALVMLFSRLKPFAGIGFWHVMFSVLLAMIFLDGIRKRSFGQILFSLAFLIIVNDKLLHLEAITPWPVLLAALVMTIGLRMLFPGFRRKREWDVSWSTSRMLPEAERPEGAVSYNNTFGNTVKYITGEVAEVYLKNSFGEMEAYFNDARLKGGAGRIHVENSFGAVQLYVPGDWRVILDLDTAFGNVDQTGENNPSGENTLYLDGEVGFGELTVHYIPQPRRTELPNTRQEEQTQ